MVFFFFLHYLLGVPNFGTANHSKRVAGKKGCKSILLEYKLAV